MSVINFPGLFAEGCNAGDERLNQTDWAELSPAQCRKNLERLHLPYGMDILPDGRAVVFNRTYDPVFAVETDGKTYPVHGGWTKGPGGRHVMFFNDGTSPFYDAKHNRRVYRLLQAVQRNAYATGYGQPVPKPDLVAWLEGESREVGGWNRP